MNKEIFQPMKTKDLTVEHFESYIKYFNLLKEKNEKDLEIYTKLYSENVKHSDMMIKKCEQKLKEKLNEM